MAQVEARIVSVEKEPNGAYSIAYTIDQHGELGTPRQPWGQIKVPLRCPISEVWVAIQVDLSEAFSILPDPMEGMVGEKRYFKI